MLVTRPAKEKIKIAKETGTLNYTGNGLTEITNEIYCFDEFTPEQGEWWTSVPLSKLILNQNDIRFVQ